MPKIAKEQVQTIQKHIETNNNNELHSLLTTLSKDDYIAWAFGFTDICQILVDKIKKLLFTADNKNPELVTRLLYLFASNVRLINVILSDLQDDTKEKWTEFLALNIEPLAKRNDEISTELIDLLFEINILAHSLCSNKEVRIPILTFMLEKLFYTYNLKQLNIILEQYKDECMEILPKLKNDAYKQKFISAYIESKYDEKFQYLRQLSDMGQLDYNGLLLLTAAINAKSEYFKPVILNCKNNYKEFETYCDLIAKRIATDKSGMYIFIIYSNHTIAGNIQWDGDRASIVLVDSLGANNLKSSEGIDFNVIKTIITNNFPKNQIIVPPQVRQNAATGCTVFAINDARKMFKETIIDENLPTRYLLSAQTTKIMDEILKDQSQNIDPKQNSILIAYKQKYFRKNSDDKIINFYIEDKLPKWRQKLLDFIINNKIEEKDRFGLESFKQEMLGSANFSASSGNDMQSLVDYTLSLQNTDESSNSPKFKNVGFFIS